MSDENSKFDRDTARRILERAIARQVDDAPNDHLDFEELTAAAAEVGVDRASLERAMREVQQAAREEETKRIESERAQIATRARRLGWLAHLRWYLVANGGLLVLDLATGPGMWAHWVAAMWGLGVLSHAFGALPTKPESRRERRMREKRERLAALEEEKFQRRRARIEAQEKLGKAVDEGVTTLMSSVAKKIESRGTPSERPFVRVRVEGSEPKVTSIDEEIDAAKQRMRDRR